MLQPPEWFKPRRYKHFDRQVGPAFVASAALDEYVRTHSFAPLLFYEKVVPQYKPSLRKTSDKKRPIMYASHKDACILSFYAALLNAQLEAFYVQNNLTENVIAYRAIGQNNVHFSAEAYRFAIANAPCTILAFDVTSFFDNLDHSLLKSRLKRLLTVVSLSTDWQKVFRFSTKYHFVKRDDLAARPAFKARMDAGGPEPIATIAEVKAAGISIHSNPLPNAGIPQGTPISAALSNLYMIDFDVRARDFCTSIGAIYRRYSDDILVICSTDKALEAEGVISQLIDDELLKLSATKTERTLFDPSVNLSGDKCAQYLGFSYYPGGAGIRSSSLSRQWRKLRRSVRRTGKAAGAAIASGTAKKAFTKKLRRRFSPLQFRNFSNYGRRSADIFGKGQKITRQVRRFERESDKLIRELEKIK